MIVLLEVVWFLAMTAEAFIIGVKGHLPLTGVFIFVVGITGLIFLNKSWYYGWLGLCLCAFLLCAVCFIEPNWFNVIQNTLDLLKEEETQAFFESSQMPLNDAVDKLSFRPVNLLSRLG